MKTKVIKKLLKKAKVHERWGKAYESRGFRKGSVPDQLTATDYYVESGKLAGKAKDLKKGRYGKKSDRKPFKPYDHKYRYLLKMDRERKGLLR